MAAAAARPALKPLALLFLIGISWGFFLVLIKTAVTGGVAPVNYLFWFTLGAGTVVLALGAVRGRWPRLGRAHLRYYFVTGALRFALANLILYSVQQRLPVGVMAVVMTMVPIFTYAVSLAVRLERLAWRRFAGILFGFAGVLLIVVPKGSLADPALAWWALFGLGAPLMHAFAYVLLSERNRPPDSDSLGLAAGVLYAAALMTLVPGLATGQLRPLWPPFTVGEWALVTHMVLAGFNFYAIFELIRISGPTYMSQANFLSVGFGVLFGMVIFGETHSKWVWAAIALIVAGVALVNARRGAPAP